MAIENLQVRADAELANGLHHPPTRETPAVLKTLKKPEPFTYTAVGAISNETLPEIIQGILGPRSVGVMAGVPNAGKTFLGLDLAGHVAAKAPSWFERKVKGGPVLYVAAEAPGSVKIRARVMVSEKFADKPNLPLYIVTASPSLGDEMEHIAECARLLATVKAIQSDECETVRLVVIDTLASVLGGGEENSNGMLLVAKCAKYIAANTEAAVLLIHHPNKGDATSLRGHSSLAGAVDTIISISSDENTGIRTATLTKSRDSAAGVKIHFELLVITLPEPDCFGDPRTTCIVKAARLSDVPKPRPSGARQQALLAELERRHRSGECGWSEAVIREAGRTIGIKPQSVRDALKGLMNAGYVWGMPANLTLKFPPDENTK